MSDTKRVLTPVRPVRVRLFCAGCDVEMKFTGDTLLSYPPKYRHQCKQCGEFSNERVRYPTIEYVED